MRTARPLFLLLAALAACGPGFAQLKPDRIATIEIHPLLPHVCGDPGWKEHLAVVVIDKDGKRLMTAIEDRTEGRLDPKLFRFQTSAGSIDASGELTLPANPLELLAPLTVDVTLVSDPKQHASKELDVYFDCSPSISFRAGDGDVGSDGSDYYGTPINAPSGQPGQSGGAGGLGGDAGSIAIHVGWVESPKRGRLALVRVNGSQSAFFYLVDPKSHGLFIDLRGGAGGPGGNGQLGIRGGDGGDGGDGGNGGEATIYYDRTSPELAHVVHIDNTGGPGGGPGAPGPSVNVDTGEDYNSPGREGRAGRSGGPGQIPRTIPVPSPTAELIAAAGGAPANLDSPATTTGEARTPAPRDPPPAAAPESAEAIFAASTETTLTVRKPKHMAPAKASSSGDVALIERDGGRVRVQTGTSCWFEAQRKKGPRMAIVAGECKDARIEMSHPRGTLSTSATGFELDVHGKFALPDGQASGDFEIHIKAKKR